MAADLSAARELLRSGDLQAAAAACGRLLEEHPDCTASLALASHVAQRRGDFGRMLKFAAQAAELEPDKTEHGLRLAECQAVCGDVASASFALGQIRSSHGDNPVVLQQVGQMYVHCGKHELAEQCYRDAVALTPDDPAALYNFASAAISLGHFEEAGTLLDKVIAQNPGDYDAWYNRSSLERQTADSNHIDELTRLEEQLDPSDPGYVPVCYALAKELEDLGRYDNSFGMLQRGAAARRARLGYDVAADERSIDLIIETFSTTLLNSRHNGHATQRPVFVLGLPRSGTTLVERILSSHSDVESLGEISDLAYALMRVVGESTDKERLIRESAWIDFNALGERYDTSIAGYGHDTPRLVDKTPLNFLYIGLIHLAMPETRIIHVRRNPIDSCYAMYKTLFRTGFPFSYRLQDVGRYYIAYRRLMDHWRASIPDAFLDVDYEKLVANQESESRRIIEYCGLDWQQECLDFHKQQTPSATASAAQVRQPIYSSSVNRWRSYERQLAPFAERLAEHGIDIDGIEGTT